ncbi:MAG TPA: AAA family ATPase [Cellvibrio sp.]|nr:AAA family ATPase [Cellvibrio sp.]
MRTEPSFSAKPEEPLASDTAEHQEELDLSPEPDETSDVAQQLANYRQRYGLSVDPFADDQHFAFYTGGQRRQILDQLLHLCQFSNNVLVVQGGYSIGKTRMAQALIDSLDDADDICFLEGQVTSSFDSLMANVLAQFELPDIETLKEFFKRQSESDGLAVLLVDNAHHLIDEVLLQLIHLMGPETRVHIVFFAEPHLLPRLQGLDIGELALSDFGLMKFSLAETVDYLNFRMEMADYLGPELFTEANVEGWWRQSRGQLLELHEYAQSKLLASAAPGVQKKVAYDRKGLPIPHIVGAAALGGILIMGWLYWSGDSSSTKERPALTTIPLPQVSAQSSAAISATPEQSTISAEPAPQVQASVPPQNEPATTPPTNVPAVAAATATAAVSIAASSSVPAQPVAETKVIKQEVVPLVQTNSASPAPAEKSIKASSLAALKEEKKAEAKKVEAEKALAKKADAAVGEKVKTVSADGAYSEQEKALLSWGEAEFTLQLVGLSSEKAVNDFVAQQPNRKDLFIFKSLRQGKDWFVVVTGRYPSSAKARQAVALLPESQKAATPWPRDLKTIQKEIKNR